MNMGILATSISLVFLIISIKIKKTNSIKPNSIFFALWTFILFLSTLNLYNINKPSNEAYLLIILMLIFFFIGSLLGHFIKLDKFKMIENHFKKNKDKTFKIIYVLFFLLSFLTILKNELLSYFVPEKKVQKEVMSIIYDDVKGKGIFNNDRFKKVLNYFIENNCKYVILGCTELSGFKKDFKEKTIDPMDYLVKASILSVNGKYKK